MADGMAIVVNSSILLLDVVKNLFNSVADGMPMLWQME